MTIMTNDTFTGHFTVKRICDAGYAFLAAPEEAQMKDIFVPAKVVQAAGLAEDQDVVADYHKGPKGFVAHLIAADEAALEQLRTQRTRSSHPANRGIGSKTKPDAKRIADAKKRERSAKDAALRLKMRGSGTSGKKVA